jgi:hypothetical protein
MRECCQEVGLGYSRQPGEAADNSLVAEEDVNQVFLGLTNLQSHLFRRRPLLMDVDLLG